MRHFRYMAYLRMRFLALMLLLGWIISACGAAGLHSEVETRVNTLGNGTHSLTITALGSNNSSSIFDSLPDFSLITGIDIQDYSTGTESGVKVEQRFSSLHQASQDPEQTFFINKVLPGTPIIFSFHWEPGLFTRQLVTRIQIVPYAGSDISALLAAETLSQMNVNYTLQLPGRIIQSNGTPIGPNAISWQVNLNNPQILEARSSVVSIPAIAALIFTLGSLVLVIGSSSGLSALKRNFSARTLLSGPRHVIPPQRPPTVADRHPGLPAGRMGGQSPRIPNRPSAPPKRSPPPTPHH